MIIEDRSVFDLPSRTCSSVEKYGEDPDNFIEIFEPASQLLGQVVLIHGGSWRIEYDLAHLRSYAGALSDAGYRVHLVEYRRTPGFPDNYSDDIRKAIEHCGGGVLIGHSAGGHLALIAPDATNSRLIKGIIALSPLCDLATADKDNTDSGAVRDFLGTAAVNRPDLDPNVRLNEHVPVLIIHGVDDLIVPIEHSRNLYNSYVKAGLDCELIELEKIGHFEPIDYRKAPFEIVLAQLKKLA